MMLEAQEYLAMHIDDWFKNNKGNYVLVDLYTFSHTFIDKSEIKNYLSNNRCNYLVHYIKSSSFQLNLFPGVLCQKM